MESFDDVEFPAPEADPSNPEEAFVAAYGELRQIASALMRGEAPSHTLQTTALLHEAFLRLVRAGGLTAEDRREYIRLISTIMRRVLVDHARSRNARKRGGQLRRDDLPSLDVLGGPAKAADVELVLSVNRALERLTRVEPFKARIVELRFFGGFTVSEVAEILDTSPSTIERGWRAARARLYLMLGRDE